MAENDDEDGSLNSALTLDTEGGTYYLQAGSYNDAGTGAYALNAVFTAADESEPGLPTAGDGYSIELVFSDNSLTASQQAVFTMAAAPLE